jgi:hypothetical protein
MRPKSVSNFSQVSGDRGSTFCISRSGAR